MRLLFLLLTICIAGSVRGQSDRFERISPEQAGYSFEKLDELEAFLNEAGSSSMLLVHDGKVFFEWGDVHRKHTIHSIRKSLLNALYGIYVERGVIDTSATLLELGIDDIEPGLSDREKSARIADLLRSRSGIYHDAAAVSPAMEADKPARGIHAPGEHFYYNNWDFNALGTVFEQLTGKSIYEAFREEIAEPIGMLHYAGEHATIDGADEDAEIPQTDGFYQLEADKSKYPAYHFRMSAHDLALYGQLWLNGGMWKGERIVPASWIEASTRAYSVTNPRIGIGYGMLWFVLMKNEERSTRSFYHTGAGVHMLAVYPGSKLVFVHRVDTENGSEFRQESLYRIISMIFGARLPER